MPLTFSHPALILPGKYLPERWVSMTGLIVGSITPDLEYFIRMRERSTYSHTWAGIFWFDLPLSLLLTFIYHYLVRNAFTCNSPAFLRRRLSKYINFDWGHYFKNHFLLVIICLLIGITSHVFWDSFTHLNGYFVKAVPFLRETVIIYGNHIPNARILQAISTVVGGLVVFYAIMRMPDDMDAPPINNPTYYWLIIIATGIITATIRVLASSHLLNYDVIALSIASGFIAGSIIAPFFLKSRKLF